MRRSGEGVRSMIRHEQMTIQEELSYFHFNQSDRQLERDMGYDYLGVGQGYL